MKIKWLLPFGMMGVFAFLHLDMLGNILWIDYNPKTMYISTLFANEAPHVNLMRFFMNTYTVCFLVFSFTMVVLSSRMYHLKTKLGYTIMFVAALISVIGYGGFPISMVAVLNKNNIVHLVVTVLIICATVVSILLIAAGYLKQEKLIALGRISLVVGILIIAFNLWHLYALLNSINILGLIERCIFYPFQYLIFKLSWHYTFNRNI